MRYPTNSKALKQMERDLLKHGTVAGPVTKEMIERCKAKGPPGYPYWADFLPIVRLEMAML